MADIGLDRLHDLNSRLEKPLGLWCWTVLTSIPRGQAEAQYANSLALPSTRASRRRFLVRNLPGGRRTTAREADCLHRSGAREGQAHEIVEHARRRALLQRAIPGKADIHGRD